MIVSAGTSNKGDVLITIQIKSDGGIQVDLTSKVKKIFGRQILETVTNTLQQNDIHNAVVTLEDLGALDFIIKARLKTAIRQIKGE